MKQKLDWPVSLKSFIGLAGCVLGLGVVYFGYGIGTESPKKDAAAEPRSTVRPERKKPVRAMNVALGNMVYFAQELGFAITGAKGDGPDTKKIAARIEGQLQAVRELYRQEVVKNPTLAGSLTFSFNVASSGEVSHVQELSSRLNDREFKKAVAAEVAKWSFAEVVSENLIVACPILFVHEGMDITTLVSWEKSLGSFAEKPALASTAVSPVKHSAPAGDKSIPAPAGREFQIKYATSLRREPNFSAVSLTALAVGTKVRVIGKQGDWLKLRATENGPMGYIRKEFVAPVDVAHR